MKRNLTAHKQKTIDFQDDPAYPETQSEESDSQIAINMVLDLKEKIKRESKFWKLFAGICALVSIFFLITLTLSRSAGSEAFAKIHAENESLKVKILDLQKSSVVLSEAIDNYVYFKTKDNDQKGANYGPQFQGLVRSLEKSESLLSKTHR